MKGLEKALKALEAAPETLRQIGAQELSDGADRIVALARQIVPVKTGRLQQSIDVKELKPSELTVTVGASAPYAGFVEYGTSRMAERPYMRPAIDAVGPEIVENMKRRLKL